MDFKNFYFKYLKTSIKLEKIVFFMNSLLSQRSYFFIEIKKIKIRSFLFFIAVASVILLPSRLIFLYISSGYIATYLFYIFFEFVPNYFRKKEVILLFLKHLEENLTILDSFINSAEFKKIKMENNVVLLMEYIEFSSNIRFRFNIEIYLKLGSLVKIERLIDEFSFVKRNSMNVDNIYIIVSKVEFLSGSIIRMRKIIFSVIKEINEKTGLTFDEFKKEKLKNS